MMRNKIYLSIYCVSYLFICDPFISMNTKPSDDSSVVSSRVHSAECGVRCLHSVCNIGFQFEPNFPIKVLRGFEPSRPRMPAACSWVLSSCCYNQCENRRENTKFRVSNQQHHVPLCSLPLWSIYKYIFIFARKCKLLGVIL